MKREQRYTVMKLSDIARALTDSERERLASLHLKVNLHRLERGKENLQCVVVEHDWPEYQPTWNAIQARVDADIKQLIFPAQEADISRCGDWLEPDAATHFVSKGYTHVGFIDGSVCDAEVTDSDSMAAKVMLGEQVTPPQESHDY